MSTLSGLLLRYPEQRPYDAATPLLQANQIQGGRTTNETALLQLADLKAKQQAEQEYLRAIQNDPEVRARLFGGSILGSLGPAGGPGGMPAPGPITQSPLGGGPAQQIPAYPDASRYAGVSPQGGGPIPPGMAQQMQPQVTPPQSVLGSLGPQPQGQPPQNPLLAMAQRDPRAAMMLSQQMQAQQDRQFKMHEQQLGMGVKVAEFVARELQGVTDQASLDQARERIRQVHPQAAAQVPQMYSKEAVESVQQRGIAIAERANTQLAEAKARNLDMETRMFPELAKRFGMEGETPAAGQEVAQPQVATGGGGANMGQRMNNPYNIKLGSGTQHWVDKGLAEPGEKAQDGGQFLKFKDPSYGEQAGLELLQGPGYRDLTVDAAMKRWSNNGYGAEIVKDIPPETKIRDLSQAQMRPLMAAMREREGWNAKPTAGAAAQAPATDPRIAQLETKIAQRTRDAKIASLMKNESLSTRLNDDANRLKDERTRLLEEHRRQQERAEEIPRAAQKQTAELEAKQQFERQRQAGPLLPEDRRKLLTGLRTDIRAEPTHKLYQDVRNGYQNVRIGAESDSAQGDLAIINGMAKILDPNSTVMSGEARNVETAQGELERWFNSPQKFFTGDRISTENRPRFLKLAHAMATEKLRTARTELTAVYEPLAKEGKIDMGQLLPLEDLQPLGPGPNVDKFGKILEKAK